MGDLYIHNLQPYIDKFKLSIFIETGTGIGTGLEHAAKYSFDKLYSIEIMPELFNRCILKFNNDNRCVLFNLNSLEGLKATLAVTNSKDNILFWLDAHFPGADFQLGTYDDENIPEIKLPLEYEINLIRSKRDTSKDMFIIDDLNLYEDGKYELGPNKLRAKLGNPSIQFIYDLFKKTHNIRKDYRHQGFLILEPK